MGLVFGFLGENRFFPHPHPPKTEMFCHPWRYLDCFSLVKSHSHFFIYCKQELLVSDQLFSQKEKIRLATRTVFPGTSSRKDPRLQMEIEVRLKNSLMAGAFMRDVEDP